MHVVIPVADEPRNPSLPYALASIRKHTPYTPVTIGKDWGLCDHIPTSQGRNKFENTDNAMRIACHELGPEFIWSNDDIYWLHPAEPIRRALGHLEDTTGSNIYAQRKKQTADLLRSLGLPTHDYESHTPLLVNKAPMLEALRLGGEKRSVYGNLTGLPDLIAPDVKLRSRLAPLPDSPWVSTSGSPLKYPQLAKALR